MEQCSGTAEAEEYTLFAQAACLCVPPLCCVHCDSPSEAVDGHLFLLIFLTLGPLFTGGLYGLIASVASLWVLVSHIQTS